MQNKHVLGLHVKNCCHKNGQNLPVDLILTSINKEKSEQNHFSLQTPTLYLATRPVVPKLFCLPAQEIG